MGAIDITITGVLYDKTARTMRPVVLIGEASLTGLGVGGGPIEGGPGKPPGVWDPTFPTPPIHLPPGYPGKPPGVWDPNFPTPPIHLPPTPPDPPDTGAVKPPPDDGGWGYFPEYGWGYFPGAGGAGPKSQK